MANAGVEMQVPVTIVIENLKIALAFQEYLESERIGQTLSTNSCVSV